MLPLPEWPPYLLMSLPFTLVSTLSPCFPSGFLLFLPPRLTAAAGPSLSTLPLAHRSVAPVRRLLRHFPVGGIFTYILVFWAITVISLFYHSLEWWKVKKGNMMRRWEENIITFDKIK